MMFTAPDVASLSKALLRWELAEYFSCGLVAIACAGEYVAEFTDWLTNGVKERKERLGKRSTLLLISALALELVCLVKTNTLSGQLIGSLDTLAGEANNRAKIALNDSAAAVTQSNAAENASGRALQQSDRANGLASNASNLASGARQEADSFEKDILSAKTQATEAESHLAEALKRAADATTELDRLKSPRSLVNTPQLISSLKPFKDIEYTFSSVFADEESINLLKAIDNLLQSAGWKRLKFDFPAIQKINVYGNTVDFQVPAGLNTGIQISVQSPESFAMLQSLPVEKLPKNVSAAVTLNTSLSTNLSPPQEKSEGKLVNIEPGSSETIRIAVGKKP